MTMTTTANHAFVRAGPKATLGQTALRFASVPALLLALPLFLVGGWGYDSWALAAVLWLGNLAISWAVGRYVLGLPQTVAAAVGGVALILRAWTTIGLLMLSVHVAGSSVAVPAAILFTILFTIDLVARGMLYANSQRVPVEQR